MSKQKLSWNQTTWSLMRRLTVEGVAPYRGTLVLAAVCMVVSAAATAGYALLMDPVVNRVFTERKPEYLWPLAIAVLATFVIKAVAEYGQGVLMSKVGLKVIADMQKRLFGHLMSLDVAFFHSVPTGKLLTRVVNDTGAMRFAVANAFVGIFKDAPSVVFLIGAMFYQDWLLAALTFFVFPLALLPIIRLGKRMRKVTANTQEQQGLLTTYLEQAIQGIRVVKAYGMEQYEDRKVGGLVDDLNNLSFKAARTRSAASPIMELVGGVAIIIVIVYGGARVIDGPMTP
ncbi:MAG TPA: ABC transporter transmembrane domain-containing protein, partial [Candidatus Omnitrophota bacterium]|nr:ABC transporter transmembrane domain-containing protein [Candidatus Omnitrophota bacterium]